MLENGANASFVTKLRQKDITAQDLMSRSGLKKIRLEFCPEPLAKPQGLFETSATIQRINLSSRTTRDTLLAQIPKP